MTSRRLAALPTALVAALSLTGCGSATTTTATAPAVPASSRLQGADYSLLLAAGWQDTTAAHHLTAMVDRVFSIRSPHATAEVARLPVAVGANTSKLLQDRAKTELAGARATAHTGMRTLTLAGAPAITYAYRSTTSGGAKVQARQVLALHGGSLHVITLVAGTAQFASADVSLGSMLASWRWT